MKAQCNFLHILSLLGEELEPGETHLIPSTEASQWCPLLCLVLTLDWTKM